MLGVLAACLSKQHEFYTEKKKKKKSLAGQLSLGVTTETGHRGFTCKPLPEI